ncbi:MAG: UDP-3-O-(3-hydroxymyristoyl)glucosamine N-acyltransferase [Rickettsiales bacterium]|nr:UDP-3-O-(3-hydroxymyristoyl)glucosamine N-acyltransferase [Rickettsiales bacterium]
MEKFYEISAPLPLGEIAEISGARLADGSKRGVKISNMASLESAGPDGVAYFSTGANASSALDRTAKYKEMLKGLKAGACFVSDADAALLPPAVVPLLTPDPKMAFIRLTMRFYRDRALGFAGISPKASIHESVRFGDRASTHVGDFAVIEAGAVIGAGCYIGSGAKVKAGVSMGKDCVVKENAVISHAALGDRVGVGESSVIGGSGFGWHSGADGHTWVPQLGRTVLEDDVDIGAGSCVDRGTMGDTVIGAGTKIDNLVQIGHNVRTGRHCIFAGMCGVAGSTTFGDFVLVGAGAGVSGHLKIGSGVQIGARGGVIQSLPDGASVDGYPAMPVRDFLKQAALLRRMVKGKKPA